MEIDIIKLRSGIVDEIEIDEVLTFGNEYLKVTDIIELNNVSIKGFITKDSLDNYIISLTIKGVMVLPCAVTLKPIDYPFNIEINDDLEKLLQEINENDKKIENTIDILPIIWENILMEIPMKVVSSDADNINIEGEGWKFITDDKAEPNINPELQKLKDLL